MRRRKIYRYIQTIALLAALAVYFGLRALPQRHGLVSGGDKYAYVERVVDGDTIKLSNGERVRLIGVDTPELHYSEKMVRDSKRTGMDVSSIKEMGQRASDFTKRLCGGKMIRLEYDVTRRDKYGRLLAYIYLDDGTFVNAKILEEGYGQVMTIPPNVRYADQFLKLQQDARRLGKGFWGIETGEKTKWKTS